MDTIDVLFTERAVHTAPIAHITSSSKVVSFLPECIQGLRIRFVSFKIYFMHLSVLLTCMSVSC